MFHGVFINSTKTPQLICRQYLEKWNHENTQDISKRSYASLGSTEITENRIWRFVHFIHLHTLLTALMCNAEYNRRQYYN
jgi:hypothetical protein